MREKRKNKQKKTCFFNSSSISFNDLHSIVDSTDKKLLALKFSFKFLALLSVIKQCLIK